jgi:general secretion pathway protein K
MGKYFCNNGGVALILVLMIIAIIVVVTFDFNSDMSFDLIAAKNVRDGITLRHAAKSGFNYALALLAEDAMENEYDTLEEDWAKEGVLSQGVSSLEGLEGVRLKVTDCSGKIQINRLIDPGGVVVTPRKELLKRFLSLQIFDIDTETVADMVDSVIDWIDTNDTTDLEQLHGAEDAYYQSQDPPYACNNGPVRTIASLRQVKGFKDIPQETFDEIVKHMTPYGDGKININTADPVILEALANGMDEDLAKEMVEYRKEEENDLRFITWYEKIPDMVNIEIDGELITTESTIFEVSSKASIAVGEGKGTLTKRVVGTVKRVKEEKTKRVEVLCWRVE